MHRLEVLLFRQRKRAKKGTRAFLYTRVSPMHQVDGFSLDAQSECLLEYTKYKKMEVVGTFSDEDWYLPED